TLLLDTKPVPVVGYKRDKRQSDFTGSADYGWCASRKMNYFGYKERPRQYPEWYSLSVFFSASKY
ncbi:MAG: hypothetical protein QNJ36_22240, partial [Calothrix sp. MO_167.B42]|nr:hypothetical protein [Calothrix sp. MO_167.B42]